ncbi:MAG: UvrD-helicase domain-containing protein, partial [Desulfobacterales bacterium]|nr:UvrD-helicase domain-containing protein [Desulfobacterales bacterium]
MQLFDLTESPLQGINLIEASAGTGKTYTITGLYLRFLLESGFSIDQILVVTFTKAATEELKDRIRATLKRAKKDFERSSSDDDLIDQLLQKFTDTASAVRSLDEALANYDQAQIYTIHGFCHKILNEYCFETGNLFDTTLLKDPTGFILGVADDFWRKILYQSQPEWVQFVVSQKITGPEYFMGLLGARDIESTSIIPQLPKPELISLEPFRRCLHRLRQLWSTDRQDILRLLHSPNLNGTIYGSVKTPHPFSGNSRRNMQL